MQSPNVNRENELASTREIKGRTPQKRLNEEVKLKQEELESAIAHGDMFWVIDALTDLYKLYTDAIHQEIAIPYTIFHRICNLPKVRHIRNKNDFLQNFMLDVVVNGRIQSGCFERYGAFVTWLSQRATWRAGDEFRYENRWGVGRVQSIDQEAPDGSTHGSNLQGKGLSVFGTISLRGSLNKIENVLNSMSFVKRQAIVLCCIEGMTTEEIAKIQGTIRTTVSTRIHSGKNEILDALGLDEAFNDKSDLRKQLGDILQKYGKVIGDSYSVVLQAN